MCFHFCTVRKSGLFGLTFSFYSAKAKTKRQFGDGTGDPPHEMELCNQEPTYLYFVSLLCARLKAVKESLKKEKKTVKENIRPDNKKEENKLSSTVYMAGRISTVLYEASILTVDMHKIMHKGLIGCKRIRGD